MTTKPHRGAHLAGLRAIFRRGPAVFVLAVAVCLVSGCKRIAIYSTPSGARVLVNGIETRQATPTSIKVRHLRVGTSYISVAKEGYRSVTPEQEVDVRVSFGNIFWSWFPPVFIKNLFDNKWKGITYPPRGRLNIFRLIEVTGNADRQTVSTAAPGTGAEHQDGIKLRDGSLIRGKIVKIVPGEKYIVRHADGSEIAYPAADVVEITYADTVVVPRHGGDRR